MDFTDKELALLVRAKHFRQIPSLIPLVLLGALVYFGTQLCLSLFLVLQGLEFSQAGVERWALLFGLHLVVYSNLKLRNSAFPLITKLSNRL